MRTANSITPSDHYIKSPIYIFYDQINKFSAIFKYVIIYDLPKTPFDSSLIAPYMYKYQNGTI